MLFLTTFSLSLIFFKVFLTHFHIVCPIHLESLPPPLLFSLHPFHPTCIRTWTCNVHVYMYMYACTCIHVHCMLAFCLKADPQSIPQVKAKGLTHRNAITHTCTCKYTCIHVLPLLILNVHEYPPQVQSTQYYLYHCTLTPATGPSSPYISLSGMLSTLLVGGGLTDCGALTVALVLLVQQARGLGMGAPGGGRKGEGARGRGVDGGRMRIGRVETV